MIKNKSTRPIVITANSSFYLLHYRKLLIKELSKKNKVVTISPVDSSSNSLAKLSFNLPWRIDRSKDLNPSSFLISLLRMFFLVRAIKPKLVHSHTLRTNLIIAIVCFFYNIPCILSFTGLGILSNNQSQKFLFKTIIKTIILFSVYKRKGLFKWVKTYERSRFIFQNNNDLHLISSICDDSLGISKLIHGSGVPLKYFNPKNLNSNSFFENRIQFSPKIEFIYCARLLISKGIKIFLELAEIFPEHDFIIYGAFDFSSKDSISNSEFSNLCNKKNITFKGHIKNPLLKNSYKNPVLIVPSSYGEGLPRAILEAFSLKIPVICSIQATINLFTEKELYIVKNKRIQEYQSVINKFIDEFKGENLKKKLKNALELSEKFSEKEIVKQTIKIYDELI
tara:strand:- start:2421 stop:3605 length:1185 start_codon:yes stop_codon:yes gene_type:complete